MSISEIFHTESIIGVIIGGVLTLIGSAVSFLLSYWKQKKDKENERKQQIKSFLNAIKSEVSCVWNRYYAACGESIEHLEENKGFISYYPIFEKYFVVYDNNTNLIGNLDKELSEILIQTYILFKGLKDSFMFNNQLLDEIKHYNNLALQTSENTQQNFLHQKQECVTSLQKYGNSIKEMYFKLQQSKDILISMINNINKTN